MLIIVIVLSIFDEQDIESTGDKSRRLNVRDNIINTLRDII
jgi:hypothetical protein